MSGKMLYRDSDGDVNRKESGITTYLASMTLTKEQTLILSPTQPPTFHFPESLVTNKNYFFWSIMFLNPLKYKLHESRSFIFYF